ncbi:MAG: oxidoreductase [Chloroflexi bacterium]|nr:oxidoreductase [Chloroflexota bacterium]MBI3763565.1 oxidoreductase [Chloroflexota bacterium]
MSENGAKPKFAMYWAAACGGCEIAVLNIHEKILDVDANFDVVFWPVAMDAKYKDVEAMPDESITLCLFNGAIRNSENEEMAHLLRRKSKILVAFGSCACEGCIPALANLTTPEAIFEAAYAGPTTDDGHDIRPQPEWAAPEGIMLHLPKFYRVVKTLDQVVPVDYTMPGCPPESHQIGAVVDLVIKALHGEADLPPAGAVIGAGGSTVCDECKRARNEKKINRFVRIQHVKPDPALCLLEQGILCSGPATRSGCTALCPAAGAPCVGCYGPAEGVLDYGARLMSAVASVIDSTQPEEIERILDGIPDPAGSFYRFNLGGSLLRAGKPAWSKQ